MEASQIRLQKEEEEKKAYKHSMLNIMPNFVLFQNTFIKICEFCVDFDYRKFRYFYLYLVEKKVVNLCKK